MAISPEAKWSLRRVERHGDGGAARIAPFQWDEGSGHGFPPLG